MEGEVEHGSVFIQPVSQRFTGFDGLLPEFQFLLPGFEGWAGCFEQIQRQRSAARASSPADW